MINYLNALSEIFHQDAGITAVVQFGNALLTYLAHTLTGEPHLSTNLLETTLLATDTEALLHDLQLAVLQYVAQYIIEVRGQRLIVDVLVARRGFLLAEGTDEGGPYHHRNGQPD